MYAINRHPKTPQRPLSAQNQGISVANDDFDPCFFGENVQIDAGKAGFCANALENSKIRRLWTRPRYYQYIFAPERRSEAGVLNLFGRHLFPSRNL
jgi:hypothetical protein